MLCQAVLSAGGPPTASCSANVSPIVPERLTDPVQHGQRPSERSCEPSVFEIAPHNACNTSRMLAWVPSLSPCCSTQWQAPGRQTMTQISPLPSSKFINSRGPPHALFFSCSAVLSFVQHFARSRLYQILACASRQPQSLHPGRWLLTNNAGPDARISHTSVQRFASYSGFRVALARLQSQLAAPTAIRHFISRLSRVDCLVLQLASYHSNTDNLLALLARTIQTSPTALLT